MTQNECQFCHSQGAPEPVEQAIKEKRLLYPKNGRLSLNTFFLFYKNLF